MVKNPPAMQEDLIPELGRSPGGGHGNPLQHSSLGNPHGQRSLVGYSPWGHKMLDTTEQVSTAAYQQLVTLGVLLMCCRRQRAAGFVFLVK